ncbi:ABC transporter substrate-binding protein [uncultured Amnibacterium sp.]|uniref:ABC transporter substrate-binding protein n=1 Tax=uncultured Amnibacterium sp. TaxID=1631851 RepID=UPI0035CB67A9
MQHPTRRRALGGMLAITATAALALTGCAPGASTTAPAASSSSGGALTPVKIQLQWVKQGQFAGYIEAVKQGYFTDEGLDVTLLEAAPDTVPQTVLASGKSDYAVAWVPKVLGSIEQGAGVTDVAQIFQRSGTLQVSLKKTGITSVADFKGKNIGSWGYGNQFELYAGMTEAGLDPAKDVKVVQQAFDEKGLLSGDIAASQAMVYNEYAQILETKNPATGKLYQPSDLDVVNWTDDGVGMYQDALWASSDKLASDKAYQAQTVKVIKAVLKGWIYARDHVEQAATDVVAAGSKLGASHQLWQTNEVNKLIWPSPDGIGMIDTTLWDRTVKIALTAKDGTGKTIITKDPPSTAYTNTYVEKALAELKKDGADVTGASFAPVAVTLKEGGQ